MYGTDTSSLEELSNTVTQLEDLKIEIKEQPAEIDEINTSIENIKQQINQVDKNILADETNIETEIVISEDSNFNTIFSNIDVIIQKVNEQVTAETERKAEEERKAKEDKILNGDLSSFAGTYKSNNDLYSDSIIIDKNGKMKWEYNGNGSDIDIASVTIGKNGTYNLNQKYYSEIGVAQINVGWNSETYIVVPVGVDYINNDTSEKTDSTKIRIIPPPVGGLLEEVYYKVD